MVFYAIPSALFIAIAPMIERKIEKEMAPEDYNGEDPIINSYYAFMFNSLMMLCIFFYFVKDREMSFFFQYKL